MTFGDIYRDARVLITGHTGFKGSWLTSWLLRQGAEICGYSKDVPTDPSLFELAGLEKRIDHRVGDVRNAALLRETILSFKPRFVFHLAAQAIVSTSYRDPLETITSNVVGTANVMEALRSVDWPCVAIIITSDKCYDNVEWVWGYRETDAMGGKDVYSGSKGAAELIFKSYYHSFFKADDCPVKIAVTRAGNVIGGGDWAADRIIADCMRAWTAGERVKIRSPAATRPWQHVLEPLSGYLTLAERIARTGSRVGEAYNFGPRAEQNKTVVQVLTELGRIWGFETMDDAFDIVANVPFHEAGLLRLNCDKALLELGWEATLSYAECMRMTGEWYRHVVRDNRPAAACTEEQIDQYEAFARHRLRNWASAGG
jgi:CDP-glucose 4,6-dehydratase